MNFLNNYSSVLLWSVCIFPPVVFAFFRIHQENARIAGLLKNSNAQPPPWSDPSKRRGMLAELARVPPGSYNVDVPSPWWRLWMPVERGGWITVDREKDGGKSLMWTTGKETHFPHGRWGCARSVSLKADGTLVAYFESALTMWITWGYGRGGEPEFCRAMDFVTWAHSRLCCLPDAKREAA